jgi:hypothetical protein
MECVCSHAGGWRPLTLIAGVPQFLVWFLKGWAIFPRVALGFRRVSGCTKMLLNFSGWPSLLSTLTAILPDELQGWYALHASCRQEQIVTQGISHPPVIVLLLWRECL